MRKSHLLKLFQLKIVQNIVAKEDIAHYEQSLLLQQCFQKLPVAEASKRFCLRERVKQTLTYNQTMILWSETQNKKTEALRKKQCV